jgi:hypothetical protein
LPSYLTLKRDFRPVFWGENTQRPSFPASSGTSASDSAEALRLPKTGVMIPPARKSATGSYFSSSENCRPHCYGLYSLTKL